MKKKNLLSNYTRRIALREKGKIVQEEAVEGNFAENSGRMGGEGGHDKVESSGILCPCHSGTLTPA